MRLREAVNGTTPADRILFVLLLLASLFGIVFIKEALPRSGDVVIETDGKVSYIYPLSEDRTVDVKSSSGSLTVEIKDRRVRVVHASCPNRLCELQGWVNRGAIICLPGRTSVIVGGPDEREEQKDRKIDAITG